MADEKFSEFTTATIDADDYIVGLHDGDNAKFTAGTMAQQNASDVDITGGDIIVATIASDGPNFGEYLTNTVSTSTGYILGGTNLSMTGSNDCALFGNGNEISGSIQSTIAGGNGNTIATSNNAYISGAASFSTLSSSDYSVIWFGVQSIVGGDYAVAGGSGNCSVTHSGGLTLSLRAAGVLASRAAYQVLMDASGGYAFLAVTP